MLTAAMVDDERNRDRKFLWAGIAFAIAVTIVLGTEPETRPLVVGLLMVASGVGGLFWRAIKGGTATQSMAHRVADALQPTAFVVWGLGSFMPPDQAWLGDSFKIVGPSIVLVGSLGTLLVSEPVLRAVA